MRVFAKETDEEAAMPRQPIRDIVLAASLTLSMAACASSETTQSWYEESDGAVQSGYNDGASVNAFIPGSATELSWDDREALGRIAYAEAGNQGELGVAAVIYTIFNRVTSGQFQSNIQDVIDAPNQFEPATRVGGWRYLPPLNSAQSSEFDAILDQILAGNLPDPTNGALFFQNARIVAARAARGKGSWSLVDFGGTPPVAEIGDHRFYDWRAAINLAAARQSPAVDDSEPSYSSEVAEYSSAAEYSPPEAEDSVAAAEPETSGFEEAASWAVSEYEGETQTASTAEEEEGGVLTAADDSAAMW